MTYSFLQREDGRDAKIKAFRHFLGKMVEEAADLTYDLNSAIAELEGTDMDPSSMIQYLNRMLDTIFSLNESSTDIDHALHDVFKAMLRERKEKTTTKETDNAQPAE